MKFCRKRTDWRLRILLSIALLIVTAHRLPAPISETPEATPAPKPKQEIISKPKPRPESTPKPKAAPNRAFAGAWAGNVISKASNGDSASANYIINISDDEKTVLVNLAVVGKAMTGPATQFSCTRFREALTWSDSTPSGTTLYTMKLNSTGTASLVREGRYTGGDFDGITYIQTGTLSRQDVSSAPSTSRTTTTTVAPQTAGIPTAKPVPNKLGFVFNPFDPKTKIILDVRGKAPGTKVKDSSGRSFIVP